MKIKFLFIWSFLFIFNPLWGQDPLFYDRFTDSTFAWEWGFGETEKYDAYIEGESLYVQHKEAASEYLLQIEALMRSREKFSFEAMITLIPGREKNQVGLFWSGGQEGEYYHAFMIRPDGHFRIINKENDQIEVIQDWTRNKKIKGAGQGNLLRIQKSGYRLHFWINGKEVADHPFRRLDGKYHGLRFWGQGEWMVDYYTIEHPRIPFPHVSGPMLQAARFPLDSSVNLPDRHETAPIRSYEGDQLYVSISSHEAGLDSGDIWYMAFQGDTAWSELAPVDTFLNSPNRNAVVRLAKDTRSMVLASTYRQNRAASNYGLSRTVWEDSVWTHPIPMDIPGLEHEGRAPSYSVSEDGEVLILALEKETGNGDLDLYVSFYEAGEWTELKHMGPDINTFGIECTPYLMPDKETLYFSSSGFPGYGQVDVYVTNRESNSWTKWSEPLNLGPQINGPLWDVFYTPFEDKQRRAYMAAQDSTGDFDIYTVRIPEDMTLKPVVQLHGLVYDKATGKSLAGRVYIEEIDPDSSRFEVPASPGYRKHIPFEKAYQIYAIVPGYFPIIDTLDVRYISVYRDVEKHLYVRPLEVGEIIRLDKVYFKRAKAELLESSYPELDRLVLLMQSVPSMFIEIQGHTDNIGSAEELMALSEARAERVRDYLIEHGIAAGRTQSKGFGASQPIASNENPATRKLNRRVEFRILSR